MANYGRSRRVLHRSSAGDAPSPEFKRTSAAQESLAAGAGTIRWFALQITPDKLITGASNRQRPSHLRITSTRSTRIEIGAAFIRRLAPDGIYDRHRWSSRADPAGTTPQNWLPRANRATRIETCFCSLSNAFTARVLYLHGYSVKTESFFAASLWHVVPHFASFPCGGLSANVAGVNVSDAAS